jgi:hypothetical protein
LKVLSYSSRGISPFIRIVGKEGVTPSKTWREKVREDKLVGEGEDDKERKI